MVVDPGDNPLDETTPHVLRSQANHDAAILTELAHAVSSLASGEDKKNGKAGSGNNGIPVEKILAVAKDLAACQRVAIVYGKGITTQADAATLAAMQALSQALGKANGTPAALISVKGKANSLAAAQLDLDQPFDLQGRQAAYLVLGDDELSKRQMRTLESTPLVIVQAAYHSAITENADIVFPVTTWAEQAGHYLNLEGRLQKAQRILEAPEQATSNLEVLQSLAERLGLTLSSDWRKRLVDKPSVVSLDLDLVEI